MNPRLDLIIPKHLSDSVIEFAEISGLDFFVINNSGAQRRYCNLNAKDTKITKIVSDFSEQCFNSIGITEFKEEPIFGNFIGVNGTGGFVHPHTDPLGSVGEYHLRLNFLVQKPVSGGVPIMDGIQYEIEEMHSWINLASSWLHSSTPVVGVRNRIVLSLGKLVSPEIVENILVGYK